MIDLLQSIGILCLSIAFIIRLVGESKSKKPTGYTGYEVDKPYKK